jgi:hypothetical protein
MTFQAYGDDIAAIWAARVLGRLEMPSEEIDAVEAHLIARAATH